MSHMIPVLSEVVSHRAAAKKVMKDSGIYLQTWIVGQTQEAYDVDRKAYWSRWPRCRASDALSLGVSAYGSLLRSF